MFIEILCTTGSVIDLTLNWGVKHPITALIIVIIVLILFIMLMMRIFFRRREVIY